MRARVCIGFCLTSWFIGGIASAQQPSTPTPSTPSLPTGTPPAGTPPTRTPPAAGDQPAAGEQDSGAVTPPKGFAIDTLDVSVEENYLTINGNRNKLEQYSTPPQGLVVPRLWLFAGRPGTGFVATDLVQPGRGDQNLLLQLFSPWSSGQYRLYDATWREHPELNSLLVSRLYQAFAVNQPFSFNGVALQIHGAEWGFSRPSPNAVFAQYPNLIFPDYNFKAGDAGLVIPHRGAVVAVREAVTDFTDHTGEQPGHNTTRSAAEVQGAISSRITGAASYSVENTNIARRSRPGEDRVSHSNESQVARLDVQGSPLESVAVRGYVQSTNSTRRFNLSGYASQVNLAGARVSWRGFPGLFVRSGYESRAISYLVGSRAATLHPRVNSAWVSARYQPFRRLQFTARYSNLNRSALPPSPVQGGAILESPVTPRDSTGLEFGASYTPTARLGLSYRFLQQRDANPQRNLVFRIQQQDWVAWAQPLDRLSLSAAYGDHHYSSGFLSPYLADARVFTGNAAFTLGTRWSINASYSNAEANRATSVRDQGSAVSASYQVGPRSEAIIDFTSGDFSDFRSAGVDTNSNGIALRLRHRF